MRAIVNCRSVLYRISFFCVNFLVFPLLLSGQNYYTRTFTTENGLPHNSARTIAADSLGFLWIGTWDGLSRYDGYEFKNYYHIPGDSTSLPYFTINDLVVDGSGNLWVFGLNGEISFYDRTNDCFRAGIPDNRKVSGIQSICKSDQGDLWVIFKDRFCRINHKTLKSTFYLPCDNKGEPVHFESVPHRITITKSNEFWICAREVYKFKIEDTTSRPVKTLLTNKYRIETTFLYQANFFDSQAWFNLWEAKSGNIWLFSNIGLFRFDKEKGCFTEYKQEPELSEFEGPGVSFIWGSLDGRVNIYNKALRAITTINIEKDQFLNSSYQQNDNLLWFSGTSSSGTAPGLTEVVFTPRWFRNYRIKAGMNELAGVYAITTDDKNNLWIGIKGSGNIMEITPGGETKKIFKLNSSLSATSGNVRSLIRTRDGIWIGYIKDILLFYDFKNRSFTRHNAGASSFRALALDNRGRIYIGDKNLSLYDPISGKTGLIWQSHVNESTYRLFFDKNGILWGGRITSQLLSYDTLNKKIRLYKVPCDSYHIEDICEGENGTLWLALLGGGIFNFNPATGKGKSYTTADGLPNNTTYRILRDKSGYLWISTDHGISRLDPESGVFHNFFREDGLKISEFNSNASYVSDEGEFYFGGMGGVVSFYPDSINSFVPKIQEKQKILITDFTVSGVKRILDKPVEESDTIKLKKGDNNFHMLFSTTDFVNSGKARYRYLLKGINNSWIETKSGNRNVNYSNLHPGWYDLRLEATDENGIWAASKLIRINIPPYFYQTRLFRAGLVFIIIMIITLSVVLYTRYIKRRETRKQDQLRLQTLQGQMNPHFIFNSLNSINYFISNNDKLSANRYIADFARLIRAILYNMNNNFITLEKEIDSIRDYLRIEYLRFGDKFDYEIIVDPDIESSGYNIYPGLIQPFVENAIWHGIRGLEHRKGKLAVRFISSSGKIVCSIEDDGLGRKKAGSVKLNNNGDESRGMYIVSERLRIINKIMRTDYKIIISDLFPDKDETGTRVLIELPVEKS